MSNEKLFPTTFPVQNQSIHPGVEDEMNPLPIYDLPQYINDGKRLKNKVAIITGGDSGIGRAVALAYAREGAKVCIIYLSDEEDKDANKTKELIESAGSEALVIKGDISNIDFCTSSVKKVIEKWGKLDILVNNAAVQHDSKTLDDIGPEQIENTFKINVFGTFYMTKAAVKYMECGSSIINTTSITAYRGNEILFDYSCTKGALTTMTRTLATMLVKNGIRVNAVAPGPIWTPLIPSSMNKKKVSEFKEEGNNILVCIEGEEPIKADLCLYAIGREANLSGIEDLDIKIDKGSIVVNSKMETSIPSIYAVGDVTGGVMLAHAAFKMGEVAASNALGVNKEVDLGALPSCVYTIPEVASVGITEEDARKKYNVKVGKFNFAGNGRALASGQEQGYVKVVADAKYGEILGIHMFGCGVAELINHAASFKALEIPTDEASELIFGHPCTSEALMEALADVNGECLHLPKK